MELKRIRRQTSPSVENTDPNTMTVSRLMEKKSGFNIMKSMGIVAACLMILPVFVVILVIYRDPPLDQLRGFAEARVIDINSHKGSGVASSKYVDEHKDKLLDGLLSAGFDENSCLSRYQSVLYRKSSPHKPSSYLQSRLRKYEDLHRQCGPHTESYNKTVEKLKSGHHIGQTDCNYLVWISYSGLGNRILTLASAFLYALLTNRVLLVDRGKDIGDLFCEPFPEMSWLLPLDFPLNQFNRFDQQSPECYGNMLKRNFINNTTDSLPPFLYLHLAHDYDDQDKLFFCDQDQSLLQKIPWLIMKTDEYFVPSLFLISSFEQELSNLFPSKDMVFHHLGRYLFHPSNAVWGLITRYYGAYLANADERVGIQIRTFDTGPPPFQHVMDQVIACFLKEKILPEVNPQEPILTPPGNRKSKAVLITSLNSGYFAKIRNMYWENPTVTGETIGVYQPSNEEHQQTEKFIHNRKAWAEMYLLSLTDVLITSSWSTFGYVAQSLGGLKPWILYKPENRTAPDPPCRRAMSMEPCFHAPPFYDCKAKTGIDTGALVPHVRHCEDMSWGLKLVQLDKL
ncbi:Fucosyltransferase [Thalictrum thalictroides]|uniref:Fucosyltransferase n=1 Tax=Thalictrum thalictroides TaxID=46969 RepID=A0A7J6X3V4_THATH|nr:Fucosyltransferase [Thalictrum thalictroides]